MAGVTPGHIVAADVDTIQQKGLLYGLAKCEVITTKESASVLQDFQHATLESATVLGTPFGPQSAMDAIRASKCEDLARIVSGLQLIPSYEAAALLRNSLSAPRLQYVLRTASCWGCHELEGRTREAK